jgi:DNA-binding NarL/FixJ family response regulator
MEAMRRDLQVLIIGDEGLLRDGVCALINLAGGFAVAEAISGPSLLQTLPLSTSPDVVVADFGASAARGSEIAAAVRGRWPAVPLLVLTFQRDDESIEAALRAGVDGYLLTTDPRSELITALCTVIEGGRYFSPTIVDRVVNGSLTPQAPKQAAPDGLSDREREVMRFIAQGLRTREIAERLSVSHKTVEKHRTNLMRKLGLRSAAAVAAYAISNGYLQT